MARSTGNRVRVETWNVRDRANRFGNGRMVVTKIAVRDSRGRYLGATNYRGTVLAKP